MKKILIVENKCNELKQTQDILKMMFKDKVEIVVLSGNDTGNAGLQQFYDESDIIVELGKIIKENKEANTPVIGIILDIFLATEEEATLTKGSNYKTNISRDILNKYGSVSKNGLLTGENDHINFVIVSRFPQYRFYAKDVSGDEEWAKYYISKRDFYDSDIINKVGENIRKILCGEKQTSIYGGLDDDGNEN